MVQGCNAFIDEHGDGLESKIWEGYGNDLETEICAPLCEGIAYKSPEVPESQPSKSKKKKKGKKRRKKKGKKTKAKAKGKEGL